MNNSGSSDWLTAVVTEYGDLGDLEEASWVTSDGETHVLTKSEVHRPDRKLFGDDPSRVREATFTFGSGARLTLDFSEARDD